MARVVLFFGVLIAHWIMQFMAWGYAGRSGPMRLLWKILATPLVHAAGSLANEHFWIVATANSVLWAGILTYVVARYALRH